MYAQALDAGASSASNRCYYDFWDMLRTNPTGNVPYTPSLPLLYGLKKSLQLMREEGMDNVVARHHRWVCWWGKGTSPSCLHFLHLHLLGNKRELEVVVARHHRWAGWLGGWGLGGGRTPRSFPDPSCFVQLLRERDIHDVR